MQTTDTPSHRATPLRVTGYSVLSALGSDAASHIEHLRRGQTGLVPHTEAKAPGLNPLDIDFKTAVGAVQDELPDLPKHLTAWSTRLSRMAYALLLQIEEPLRRAREKWRPDRIAVLLGTSTAGAETTEVAYKQFVNGEGFPADYDFQRQHTFGAVLSVVRELAGVDGPSWMASTACTSSGKTFASAQRLIASGAIDAAIVGGLDTLCTMTLTGFHALQALDSAPCRPFRENRNGISIGEGGAFALVEREGEARMLVEGVGETSDAYHISAPHPEGLGAQAAMRQALAQAGCKPEQVDHVNAHGTGTRLNDSAEANAIQTVLGTDVPCVSTKAYTGHTLGAAAAIEFAFAAMAIENGFVPPAIGDGAIDDGIRLRIPTTTTKGTFKRVLSNSFAFGGNNVSLVVAAP